MKRMVLIPAMVIAVLGAGPARAAAEVRPVVIESMAMSSSRLAVGEFPLFRDAAKVWPSGFKIKAGRLPDGWIEARRAAHEISPAQAVLGAVLVLILLSALGALFASLALMVKPRGLTWSALTRPSAQEILGRL